MMQIEFDMIVLKEGKTFVAYSPELDVSSCGNTVEEAKKNLKTAVRLFLEEAEKMGTVEDILIEAGYQKEMVNNWIAPRMVATELVGVY
ncbi:MAG: type II toxin-antitoxin system HicB family antitoxin [Candidatus Diapherotrites archaeon]